MPINIFNEAQERAARFSDDLVGRFRSGVQINNRPQALNEWRITTGDPDVAAAVADLFGGTPQEWETTTEERLEVLTEAAEVSVVLEGPHSVSSKMVLWGRKGPVRKCDGVQQDDGQACACPSALADRKDAAKAGTGCEPSISVFFRLADAPDLGKFRFHTASWTAARDLAGVEDKITAANDGGPVLATLGLELVEWTTKEGTNRAFTKPTLSIVGPAPVPADEDDGEPF